MAEQDLSGNPVKELGRRFFITFLLGIVIYRLGAVVPVPGVDVEALSALMQKTGTLNDVLRWANMFNGGTIEKASIFGLGVMPYISASIIFQLLAFSVPALKALQREGEVGRRKINQYTRYGTVVICLAQSGMAAAALANLTSDAGSRVVPDGGMGFILLTMLVVTTGSMALLWLAEQITKFGVGNGVSVVIMVGILAGFPAAIGDVLGENSDLTKFLALALVFVGIIAGMVIITLARRRINLEQQRRVQGNRVYGGAQTQVPLMLNMAGVIPVIFTSPVLIVVGLAVGMIPGFKGLFDHGTPVYRYVFAATIIFFTFFYISVTVDLNEWANNFKQSGFFVRGVKPGAKTVEYLRERITRLTCVGAASLAAVTILPELIGAGIGLSNQATQIVLGGIGLLIVVGVCLDVIQKVSTYLLAHQYQGMMQSGQQAGGSTPPGGQPGPATAGRKRF